jgi:hypothetical protein
MKAQELRIGNLYDDNSSIKKVNPNTILEVWKSERKWCKPIPLAEKWHLKLGLDNWGDGKLYKNEYETYNRFVLHNVLDGISNFEVHCILSSYGSSKHKEFIVSCDEDERINFGCELEHVHQLQNLYFALTGEELTINKDKND